MFVYTTICNYVLIRTLYIFVEAFYELWFRVMEHSWLPPDSRDSYRSVQ